MDKIKSYLPHILSIFISFIFIQSLFFKFTDSPETLHIFGTLDEWAGTFGMAGLFAPSGLFSAYVIGSAELVASAILLASLKPDWRWLAPLGGLMSTGIMTGAIFFHLFTPLGVDVQNDGGLLFANACLVWLSGLIIALWYKSTLIAKLQAR